MIKDKKGKIIITNKGKERKIRLVEVCTRGSLWEACACDLCAMCSLWGVLCTCVMTILTCTYSLFKFVLHRVDHDDIIEMYNCHLACMFFFIGFWVRENNVLWILDKVN